MLHSESRQVFHSVLFWFTIKRLIILHVLEITICAYLLTANRKIFLFCLFVSLGPASLVGKKEKVGRSAIFHFFPSRVSSRFLLVRSFQTRCGRVPYDEGWFSQSVKTSQKVGKGLTIRKVMGGREIFKPQEFFSLSNSLYEFFLGHSMKFWGEIFLI